ncbi:signal recognition particle, SRP9/SRP14 subunit [Umbelopsis sp. PMI_123]|nr:signal recognition particle, SRP9/SRP14 subunit [Umbelopsis sp. PMI_123]
MYLDTWDDFQKAAEDIYIASPSRTRYVSSYRHIDGELILKVTDDRSAVKYKTKQSTDLKKFIGLNRSMMSKMQNIEPPEVVPASESTVPQQQATTGTTTAKPASGKSKKSKKNRK